MMTLPTFNARQLAKRFLAPTIFDWGLFSGVFVQARSQKESSQFIYELAAMLQAKGLDVATVASEQMMAEDGLEQLARTLHNQFLGGCPRHNDEGVSTLADVLYEITRQRTRSVALLLSDAGALPAKSNERILKALKAARDRVNLEPGSNERFLFVATCIFPVTPSMYVEGREQAFYGAVAGTLAVAGQSSPDDGC
ncbi:hypothetical protein Jab_2c22770 [Janthinobacterium sp. HH01]|uniref:hypothetical protein n=1 Tax=Janthinobacterium sp. HH01 TaxID=1198452 RepID=UPI0002AEBA32|nr:hypothetical protein [Janthinobacterium sp. HH01]ELX10190.1 hypothetical protein Jab_2c22770 [Janthinobacterium sp. HH01]